MGRLRDGDMAAFGILFSKYRSAVAAFAYRFLHSRDRAEEISQSVFLQLFRTRERYEPNARFTSFLYRIAKNLCLNELRRFEHSVNIESLDAAGRHSDGDGSTFAGRLIDMDSPGPEQRLAGREAAAKVFTVLRGIPSNQRRALLLNRVDGLSHRVKWPTASPPRPAR